MVAFLKVFFNLSFRSDTLTKNYAKRAINWLEKNDYISTYDCFNNGVNQFSTLSHSDLTRLFSSSTKALSRSDIVILEVSTNSFTQGYILQKALEMYKPVIALHRPGKYPVFLKGIETPLLQILEYDEYNLDKTLKDAIKFAIDNLETRFNVYLSQEISQYLSWFAKKKKLSKSAVVREVLLDHMQANQEYTRP